MDTAEVYAPRTLEVEWRLRESPSSLVIGRFSCWPRGRPHFHASGPRAQILANLHRWRRRGVWVSAYDEWRRIAASGDDGLLFAAMLGRDEEAVRLRQSMPYVGLLPESEVNKLHEEAGA